MKRLLGLLLVITLTITLSACNWFKRPTNSNFQDTKVLVVGYDPFSGKFSPFFADTAYDQDVVSMTSVSLMTTDRDGGIIYNAIEGQDVKRGANTYHYSGLSDITVVVDDDDPENVKTTYDVKIKSGVKFSDGHELNADDIIFTYYVLLDPYYNGSSTLNSVNIVGLKNYLYNSTATSQAEAIAKTTAPVLIENLGTEQGDATLETYVTTQIAALLQSEYQWVANDVMSDSGYSSYWKLEDGTAWSEGKTASATATFAFFYGLTEGYSVVGKTSATVVSEVAQQYGYDFELLDTNYGGPVVAPLVEAKAYDMALKAALADLAGDPVPNITGITRVSDTEVKVEVNGFDAAAIYQVCGVTVAPMHYYGDESKYDFANNKFGFDNRAENSMELIGKNTDKPLGAGPYKFVKYENNVVYFEANQFYYKGAPLTKYINFQVVSEATKVSAIATGDIDVSNPSGSKTRFAEIASYGDKINVSSIDNLGYGYIGINAKNVNVGGVAGSAESKALRTAFATVLASQRYTAVKTYYDQAANVINYPISNTSWAAPKQGEVGYEYAFSKNPDGTFVYGGNVDPATLADSARTASAKLSAKAWLIEAGYTFTEKAGEVKYGDKLYTAVAPAGAKTSYEVIIPGGGTGDHPSFAIVTAFKAIMAELGITITINDPADSNVLWDALDSASEELWCAAWGSTIDPDMYQVYYSTNVVGGGDNSTNSNHYFIQDPILDQKIMSARTSSDQAYRKGVYKEALDIVLDWAVEVPVYQRQNIIAISSERVDLTTLTPEITTYWGWMSEIEKLQMK